MEVAEPLLIALAAFVILDRIGLWAESRGWIYYRKRKGSGAGLGNALAELDVLTRPSAKHVVELKQKDSKQRDDQGDGNKPDLGQVEKLSLYD